MADLDRLRGVAEQVNQGGFTDVILLGMGGSSLGPEVLGKTFGQQAGWPRFHMLDSTDPAQIRTIERAVDLGKTLVIVSSKSGSTLEPNIFMDYFFDRVGAVRGKDKAGEHFIAVTDPGSPLERRANQLHFCSTSNMPTTLSASRLSGKINGSTAWRPMLGPRPTCQSWNQLG